MHCATVAINCIHMVLVLCTANSYSMRFLWGANCKASPKFENWGLIQSHNTYLEQRGEIEQRDTFLYALRCHTPLAMRRRGSMLCA